MSPSHFPLLFKRCHFKNVTQTRVQAGFRYFEYVLLLCVIRSIQWVILKVKCPLVQLSNFTFLLIDGKKVEYMNFSPNTHEGCIENISK